MRIAAVEAKSQEAAEEETAGEIKEEDKASARLEEMEEGPSGGSEHGTSLNCRGEEPGEEPSEQMSMEGLLCFV